MTRPTQSLTQGSRPSRLRQMYQVGDRLEAQIEGLGSRGEGLFHHEGYSVFVPKTLVGDEVVVEVLATKGKFLHTRVLEFKKRGPSYREPRCQHFMECGGCDFQHIPYSEQLEWKKAITQHWIKRSPLAHFVDHTEFDAIASPKEFHYRHRARIQVIESQAAFLKSRSHQAVLLKECPVLEEGFFEEMNKLAQERKSASDLSLLFSNGKLVEQGSYNLDGNQIPTSREMFSQPNLYTNEKMWKRIQEDLKPGKLALDLFCGSGNFSAGLRKHFQKVIGVESNPLSIRAAKESFPEIDWITAKVEHELPHILKLSPDFVLMDPSREGALEVCRRLADSDVPRIIYVSCQLDTLIRDLTSLVKKGPYQILRWTTADLLPQTKHIESIVSLSLKS